MKHLWKALALTLALAALPVLGLAQETAAPAQEAFGAAAVEEGAAYTLEEMLNYTMQDEYLAKASYEAIQQAFGVNNPFANIMRAEITHQELLRPLFDTYGFAVPADTSADFVVLPATLQEAYETGVAVEIANIAMYEDFLSRDDLPQDVRDVFTALMNASQSHLAAFTRNAEKPGSGLGNGMEQGRNRKPDSEHAVPGNDLGARKTVLGSAEDCVNCGSETAVTVAQSQQARGGRRGWN